MNKLVIKRCEVRCDDYFSGITIDYKEPLEFEIDFEMHKMEYYYRGHRFTVENVIKDLDNDRWVYETKPIQIN